MHFITDYTTYIFTNNKSVGRTIFRIVSTYMIVNTPSTGEITQRAASTSETRIKQYINT